MKKNETYHNQGIFLLRSNYHIISVILCEGVYVTRSSSDKGCTDAEQNDKLVHFQSKYFTSVIVRELFIPRQFSFSFFSSCRLNQKRVCSLLLCDFVFEINLQRVACFLYKPMSSLKKPAYEYTCAIRYYGMQSFLSMRLDLTLIMSCHFHVSLFRKSSLQNAHNEKTHRSFDDPVT